MKNESKFVYVTYIRTTQEKLWSALTTNAFLEQFWLGYKPQAEWKKGGAWKIVKDDGGVADSGEIVELEPPRRIVIRWRGEMSAEYKAEGYSTCTMELEPQHGVMKLTVTHTMEHEASKFIGAVSNGWPLVLSNLKSFLETGSVAIAAR